MGLMVLAAANAAENGGDAAEALAARRARPARSSRSGSRSTRSSTCAGAGGSAPRGAWIGSTLKIKPILTLEEEITPIERVRTRSRAFERMVDYARQRHEAGADAWVVQHIQDPEAAERLVEACRPIFGSRPRLHLGDRPGDRRPRRPGPARDRRRSEVSSSHNGSR